MYGRVSSILGLHAQLLLLMRALFSCRPLPEDMLSYAQTDVHYLLYVADMLQSELALKGGGALEAAYQRSHAMCLSLYTKPSREVRDTLYSARVGIITSMVIINSSLL